jgi:hypothetical protein
MRPLRFLDHGEIYQLPRPPQPVIEPGSFFLWPIGGPTTNSAYAGWQCALYQLALEQALAVARPSILERDLIAVWN